MNVSNSQLPLLRLLVDGVQKPTLSKNPGRGHVSVVRFSCRKFMEVLFQQTFVPTFLPTEDHAPPNPLYTTKFIHETTFRQHNFKHRVFAHHSLYCYTITFQTKQCWTTLHLQYVDPIPSDTPILSCLPCGGRREIQPITSYWGE